jgi:hypothetical protein
MADTGYIQVPPQSTGKKVATVEVTQLQYDNLVGNFEDGNIVTGATSGATGRISGATGTSDNSGVAYLYLIHVNGLFVNNEFLQIANLTFATANIAAGQLDVAIQKMVIADPDNPSYIQKIDRFGATVNTFSDGSPVFGAFGTLTVGQPHINRAYRYSTGLEEGIVWQTQLAGSATNTWEGNKTASLSTCTSALGDKVQRTTNFYHPYIPGVGLNIETTLQIGDTGKAGCRRRWGYYDDNDGFYWELDGTDFYVVKRSSISGTPVDTRVIQSDFNRDQIDGSDTISFTLDVSKANMYWMDIQWHGAGRVRMGVYEPNGVRLTIHEFVHGNTSSEYPYIRSATLPMRFEQENTGSTVSTSEMRTTSALIRNAYRPDITGTRQTANSSIVNVTTAGGEIPLFSVRPKTTFNGYPNRSIWQGISLSLTNIVNAGGSPVIFRVRGAFAAALTGTAFSSHNAGSTTEIDQSATAINTALTFEVSSFIVSGNTTTVLQDLVNDPFLQIFELVLGADGITQPELTVTAECLTGTSADVIVSVNWQEIKY